MLTRTDGSCSYHTNQEAGLQARGAGSDIQRSIPSDRLLAKSPFLNAPPPKWPSQPVGVFPIHTYINVHIQISSKTFLLLQVTTLI